MSDLILSDTDIRVSRSEFERFLRTDPEIVAIHWPPQWEFGEVNRDLWSSKTDSYVELVRTREDWMRLPCVEDTFGSDYSARRKWRGKERAGMTPYENALWRAHADTSALRLGAIMAVAGVGDLFNDYVGGNQQEMAPYIQELGSMTPKSQTEYDMLTTRQKIELVGRLKEKLFHVLQNFYMPDIPNYD